jgi:hypothetical protein
MNITIDGQKDGKSKDRNKSLDKQSRVGLYEKKIKS